MFHKNPLENPVVDVRGHKEVLTHRFNIKLLEVVFTFSTNLISARVI